MTHFVIFVSIFIQLAATYISWKMYFTHKNNVGWLALVIGFTLMITRRAANIIFGPISLMPELIALCISLFMAFGVWHINRKMTSLYDEVSKQGEMISDKIKEMDKR